MKKRISINLSNKVFYTLFSIVFILILGVGVYAAVPTPGHARSEIEPCTNAGDVMVMSEGVWGCIASSNLGGTSGTTNTIFTLPGSLPRTIGMTSGGEGKFNGPVGDDLIFDARADSDTEGLKFYVNGVQRMVVLKNGRVGIGNFVPVIRLAIGDPDTGIRYYSEGNFTLTTNGADVMKITTDNNYQHAEFAAPFRLYKSTKPPFDCTSSTALKNKGYVYFDVALSGNTNYQGACACTKWAGTWAWRDMHGGGYVC